MTNEEKNEGENWLSTLFEGGLPQILAGPAGKAISRLIGSTVDIPVAYLEGFAQDIRDKSDARSAVSKAIAEQVAQSAAQDPDIIDRAMRSMVNRAYVSQVNKEAVASLAVEDLAETPPSQQSEGPSDDWMNKFERYAEDASSGDLRMMFGKLLASEIRAPGAIHPTTMHFVSMLDGETAKLIERVMPICTSDGIAFIEAIQPELTIPEISYIEQSGFWTPEKSYNLTIGTDGLVIQSISSDGFGVALRGEAGAKVTLDAAVLSRAGKDLCATVNKQFDYQAYADAILAKPHVAELFMGKLLMEKGRVKILSPTQLFRSTQE